jgi:hypothetical protein
MLGRRRTSSNSRKGPSRPKYPHAHVHCRLNAKHQTCMLCSIWTTFSCAAWLKLKSNTKNIDFVHDLVCNRLLDLHGGILRRMGLLMVHVHSLTFDLVPVWSRKKNKISLANSFTDFIDRA